MLIRDVKTHEFKVARLFPLTRGSVIILDRGYMAFALLSEWISKRIYFATRMKQNATTKSGETNNQSGYIHS